MNRWVERYNRVAWAVASAHRLPFIDFHQVLARLPGSGLAADGVHPNVYVRRAPARVRFLRGWARIRSEPTQPPGVPDARSPAARVRRGRARRARGGPIKADWHGRRAVSARRGALREAPRSDRALGFRALGLLRLRRARRLGTGEVVFRVRVDPPRASGCRRTASARSRRRFSFWGKRLGPMLARRRRRDGVLTLERPGVYHVVVETEPHRRARRGRRRRGVGRALRRYPRGRVRRGRRRGALTCRAVLDRRRRVPRRQPADPRDLRVDPGRVETFAGLPCTFVRLPPATCAAAGATRRRRSRAATRWPRATCSTRTLAFGTPLCRADRRRAAASSPAVPADARAVRRRHTVLLETSGERDIGASIRACIASST